MTGVRSLTGCVIMKVPGFVTVDGGVVSIDGGCSCVCGSGGGVGDSRSGVDVDGISGIISTGPGFVDGSSFSMSVDFGVFLILLTGGDEFFFSN